MGASSKGYEKIINSLLNAFGKEENEKLFEFIMQENDRKDTAIHIALMNGHEKIVNLLLLNAFGKEKNEKFLKFMMKKNKYKQTALDLFLVQNGNDLNINSLLNAFDKKDKTKFIEYLMKENKYFLHLASFYGNERIVNSLLNVFNKEENEKLIEFLMKENKAKKTALYVAEEQGQSHEKIVKLLTNQTIQSNLQKIIQIYKKPIKKNKSKLSSIIFVENKT